MTTHTYITINIQTLRCNDILNIINHEKIVFCKQSYKHFVTVKIPFTRKVFVLHIVITSEYPKENKEVNVSNIFICMLTVNYNFRIVHTTSY